jgi:carbonic anhydrase/acetyltransferase-like protein (isoleucine patch superfamily)
MILDEITDGVRTKSSPFYSLIHDLYKYLISLELQLPKRMAGALYSERTLRLEMWRLFTNKLYYEPLLRSRCASVGANLKCDGDIPLIVGSGTIIIGDNVFIGNKGAWFVTPNLYEDVTLKIGSNTSINYRTVISVECMVSIGSNCLIAEETKIFDNNSHSIDFKNRRMTVNDAGPIVIEDDVWIGMNSIILKNVTIGRGAVVAAGSVVTKNVAPMTLVGASPARLMKNIA